MNKKLNKLNKLNKIREILSEQNINTLRPPQEKVLNNGLLDKNKNFLICIPTASGKTLIGEMAFINHLLNENKSPTGKKGLFIVPLKALASEKYEEFKEKYEKYNLKIALSIGDFDEEEHLENYDLIITTSEKLDSLIRHEVKWINDISVIVVDEIHLIGCEGRGGTLEIILTKLKEKQTKPQIIGLSATIGNPEELAKWLNAKLIIDNWRPVDLRKGIYLENNILFINENNSNNSNNTNNMDNLTFNNKKIKNYSSNHIYNLVVDCINNGGSCIVFCNSKNGAIGEAEKIKKEGLKKYISKEEQLKLIDLKEEILSSLDTPTELCKKLANCVENGVAFHHAGLVYDQRKIVENGFKNKLIKVICATPTLSAGINLPCRRAIVKDTLRFNGRYMDSISKMEIQQCIGRAGRPNLDPYGEGIIYFKNNTESNIKRGLKYLVGPVEEIYSKLSNSIVLRTHILGLIATNEVNSSLELEKFIKKTFYSFQYGDINKILQTTEEIVEFLEKNKFIDSLNLDNEIKSSSSAVPKVKSISFDENGNLQINNGLSSSNKLYTITPIGKRISDLYIDPLSGEIIINSLKDLINKKYNTINEYIILILHTISKTTELNPPIRVRDNEKFDLKCEMIELNIDDLDDDSISSFKTAKLFYDWINEMSDDKLLKKYTIEPGILRYKTEQAKWILHSTKELFNILINEEELTNKENKENIKLIKEILDSLEIRIEYGVKEDILNLLKIRYVGRARARKLYNSGIRSKEEILNNKIKVVKLLGEKISKKIFEQLDNSNIQQTLI